MRKKILGSTVALLALSMMAVSPARAKPTKKVHTFTIKGSGVISFDKMWYSGNTMHAKGGNMIRAYSGSLGLGHVGVRFEHVMLNLKTGRGTFSAKWKLLVCHCLGEFEGAFRGIITTESTGLFRLSGTFTGTHGTLEFEGMNTFGRFEGTMLLIMGEWIFVSLSGDGTIIRTQGD